MSMSSTLLRPLSLHAFSSTSAHSIACCREQANILRAFYRRAANPFVNSKLGFSKRPNFFAASYVRDAQIVAQPEHTSVILELVRNGVLQATHRSSRIFRAPSSSPPRPQERAPVPPSSSQPPPKSGFRRTLDSIPSDVIFWGILVLNGIVYMGWQYAASKYVRKDPSWYIWMQQNFTASMANVREGRVWTVISSCFSHENTSHIFFNGLTYYWMAPAVLQLLGNTRFLALYLGGGLAASCASLWWNNSVKTSRTNYSSHGASGAIYSVVSFFACLAPTTKFYLFAIIPVPAWAFLSGIIAWDGYTALYERKTTTDAAGHIGGIAAGVAYYLRLRFRLF